jgi:hypothetical protein
MRVVSCTKLRLFSDSSLTCVPEMRLAAVAVWRSTWSGSDSTVTTSVI